MSVFPENFDVPYQGEKFIWRKFKQFLPERYISYHNYAIGLKEADVIVLCPDKGVLIMEIKGFWAKNIINVPDNQTIIRKNNVPDLSPYKQARNYMHLLNSEFSKNGLEEVYVVPSVAYPFINKKEFFEKELDKISALDITFTSEDFASFETFYKKTEKIFDIAYEQFNRPQLVKNCFNDLNFSKVRQLFEGKKPVSKPENEERKSVLNHDVYSRFVYVADKSNKTEEFYRELLNDIFRGVEIHFYTKDEVLLNGLKEHVVQRLNQKNLAKNKEFFHKEKLVNNHFFNFGMCDLGSEDFEIQNGEVADHENVLQYLNDQTAFNFNQYKIEHAPGTDIIVSAGAGTGKTYSLVARINYLIWKNKYSPRELSKKIVMLTFTNDAADSMREKIQTYFLNKQAITGNTQYFRYYECVEDMNISTIHSLTKKLVQKYSVYLGLGQNYKIVSGTHVKERIVKKFLDQYIKDENLQYDQLGITNYLLVKRILSLIEKLDNKNIDVVLDDSKFGQADNTILNSLFLSVIKGYQSAVKEYQKENNCIFLSELIKTLKWFVMNRKEIPEQKMADKVDYLFVDEFQDTDDVQIEMMCKFANLFGYNFFVVGDIKQCIYRFRGAEVKAFDTLKMYRPNTNTYSLNKNYRTDADVLNYFNRIFSIWNTKNLLTYKEEDRLKSRKHFKAAGITELNGDTEACLLPLLRNLAEQSKNETTAILVRYNYQIEQIKQICISSGISVETEVGGELFKIDPTIDFFKLVQSIRFCGNREYLYNLYTTAYVSEDIPKKYLFSYGKNGGDFTELFRSNPPIANWNRYIEEMRVSPVLKVLRDLVNDVKPWDNAANHDYVPESERDYICESYRKNLDELFETLLQRANSDYITLNNISDYLEIMILTKYNQEAREPYHRKSVGNNIICTTVHKSKGLEYDNVILPFCSFDIVERRPKGAVDVIVSQNKIGINVKLTEKDFGQTFNNRYRKEFEKVEYNDRKQEEARILYVAMTRAVKRLYFINSETKNKVTWANLIKGN